MQVDRRHGVPREIGKIAEDEACRYLQHRGLKLVARNYHCRCGEIDLIMKEAETLVFVEVRYRRNPQFCSGAETVDLRKQQKLISTALFYLQQHGRQAQPPARFDVISMSRRADETVINWIQDAFQMA